MFDIGWQGMSVACPDHSCVDSLSLSHENTVPYSLEAWGQSKQALE